MEDLFFSSLVCCTRDGFLLSVILYRKDFFGIYYSHVGWTSHDNWLVLVGWDLYLPPFTLVSQRYLYYPVIPLLLLFYNHAYCGLVFIQPVTFSTYLFPSQANFDWLLFWSYVSFSSKIYGFHCRERLKLRIFVLFFFAKFLLLCCVWVPVVPSQVLILHIFLQPMLVFSKVLSGLISCSYRQ